MLDKLKIKYECALKPAGANSGNIVRQFPRTSQRGKKMRKINYDSHIENLRGRSLRLYTKMEAAPYRLKRSRKSRSPEEDLILFLLDCHRWAEAFKNRSIEKISSRRYRWNG